MILIDYKALKGILKVSMRSLYRRLIKWVYGFILFDFKVYYCLSKINLVDDLFRRLEFMKGESCYIIFSLYFYINQTFLIKY